MKILTLKSYGDSEKLAHCVVTVSQQGWAVPMQARERGGMENKLIPTAWVRVFRHYNSLLLVPASFYSAAKQLNVLQSHGQHGGLTLNGDAKLTRLFSHGQKLLL